MQEVRHDPPALTPTIVPLISVPVCGLSTCCACPESGTATSHAAHRSHHRAGPAMERSVFLSLCMFIFLNWFFLLEMRAPMQAQTQAAQRHRPTESRAPFHRT